MAMIAEILYCWAKYENWRERRRQRKAMHGYEAASQDMVYFRPVEHNDMGSIKKLEVRFWLPVNLSGMPAQWRQPAVTPDPNLGQLHLTSWCCIVYSALA